MARYNWFKKLPILAEKGIYVGSTPASVIDASGNVTATTLSATTAVILKDSLGKILIATGTTVPADEVTTYAKGALFIDTNVATGTSGLYVNVGTSASCVFKLVTNAE